MHWVHLALFSALFSGSYHFFLKGASGHVHQVVGAIILQAVALLCGLACLIVLHTRRVEFEVSAKGMSLAALAGLGAGLSEIIAFYMFARGVPASVGIPVIVSGAVLVGAVLGFIVLRESFHLRDVFAALCIIGGIVILSSNVA